MRSFSLRTILDSFTPKRLLVIYGLFFIFVLSTGAILLNLYKKTLAAVPTYGGSITEGVTGNVRFINPVLAETQTDKDLTSLVYSGLMRRDAEGVLIPDLAEDYTVSDDNLTYTFTLKPNATFHDGTPVTAEDIVFTIKSIQSPNIKSPYTVEWEGVTVEALSENTVRFSLKKEYADFLTKTTVGIIPKALWGDLNAQTFTLSEYNQKPIGSGPFEIDSIHSSKGIPDTYTLKPFRNFVLGRPYLDEIVVRLYQSEEAREKDLQAKNITNAARLSTEAASSFKGSSDYTISERPLSRVFGLYINQSKNQSLTDASVRAALGMALDKKSLVTNGLKGFAKVACSPIPDALYPKKCDDTFSKEGALELLQKDGYTKNENGILVKNNIPLSITITSTNSSEDIVRVTDLIKENLELVGFQVNVIYKDITEINQQIIKDRNYEILLYAEEVKSGDDLYAFWHSSERTFPGLNLALYANKKVDDLTEAIRKTHSAEERANLYQSLDTEIQKDTPAIFLYNPSFIYMYQNNLHIKDAEKYGDSSNRFRSVYTWYINQEYVFDFIPKIHMLTKLRSIFY